MFRRPADSPFGMVKLLSWSFFALVLSVNLVLSAFLADSARRTLLKKQEAFALLLAENLNHQIFQRFTLPTLIGFGRIQLKQKAQFERLDKVVRSTTHSFHVLEVRIYDFEKTVAYGTDENMVGQAGLAGPAVAKSLEDGGYSFEIVKATPTLLAFFTPRLAHGSVVMRTVYALRADHRLDDLEASGPITGALEFTQDISADYSSLINFQRLIIMAALLSSVGLILMLLFMIRRADRILALRAREKQTLERELHQAEKLASMGRMVSGIAHEIRNPLGIIRSSSELLLKKAEAEQPGGSNARLLQAIFDESKRLSRVVNDFLDYARPKAPKFEPVDMAQVLDQVAVFLEPKCQQQRVAMVRDYAPGAMVLGDRDLLYRAVYNLVANALEAMEDMPSAECEAGGAEIRLSVHVGQGHVSVNILDCGPGFSTEVLEKVRDPFFTTKQAGTGLGLTIVENILSGHRAQLHLGNRIEGGARVEIVFPSPDAPDSQGAQDDADAAGPAGSAA